MSKIIIGHTTFAWLLCLFLLLLHETAVVNAKNIKDKTVVDIGVIFNFDSHMWKEVQTAIKIACRDYNNNSSMTGYKLKAHYKNSHGSPLQAVSAAKELIKEEKVKVIIGLDQWQEAILVAEFCNGSEIPVISLARSPLPPKPTTAPPWPLLIQMSTNMLDQIRCIKDIIYTYNKQRVSIIYEEEAYGDSNSGILSHLYKELGVIRSEVVDHVLLPTFTSSSNSETLLKQSLVKIKAQPPSLIIVLQLSLPMTTTLLKESKKIGIFGEGCEWIFAESPSSLLDSIDLDLSSSMKDVIGIMQYHPRNNIYLDFLYKFGHEFHLDRKEVSYYHPRIHAFRAHDIISTISNAIEKVPSDHFTSKSLFRSMVQNKFTGLSGEIYYEAGQLLHSTEWEITSFEGKKEFREPISFWSPKRGFSKNLASGPRPIRSAAEVKKDSNRVMIGVPRKTFFDRFVKERIDGETNETSYTGFCIDVFYEVLRLLNYKLEYEFSPHDGTYDELVDKVSNGTFGAAVGDVTILANRHSIVEFTQSYVESRLSIIVQADQAHPENAWIIIKPFTPLMWVAFGGILIYTMFAVWVLEHRSNPEFNGLWTHQISTTVWFTFSSLFFAHREQIHCNFTRIVMMAWFFVALILTQSYTASLTSMLTVQGLSSKLTNNARVGCDNGTFLCNYLENVLGFNRESILDIATIKDYDYGKEFQSGNITALFTEQPYERAFLARYCNGYVVTDQSHRFGGFGFVFPKGSSLVDSFNKAILKLLESGDIKILQDKWFTPECISRATAVSAEAQRLSLNSFWGLLVSAFGILTLSLLLSLVCFRKSHCHQIE